MKLPVGWETWGLVQGDYGRERPDPTDTYYVTAYLSSGLVMWDPLCVQVWAMDARMLVAAFETRNQAEGATRMYSYELGRAVAAVAPNYVTDLGRPTVDPQSRGGYVDQFIEGLEAGGFRGSLSRETWLSKEGESVQAGYGGTTGEKRQTMDNILGAAQRAIDSQDCTILSASVLRSLMLASVDETGELQVGPGRKIGPVICAGRALHVLNLVGKRRRVGRKWETNPIPRLRAQARAQASRRGPGAPQEDWGT